MKDFRFNFSTLYKILNDDGIGAIMARGAGGAFVVSIIGSALSLGVQMIIARGIGVKGYGVFIYVVVWCNLLALFGKMGLDTAILRFAAVYKAKVQWGLFRGIVKRSNQLVLITSIVIGVMVFAFVWVVKEQLESGLPLAFWIGCFSLPILSLTTLNLALLRALLNAVLAQLPIAILQPVFLAALFLLFSYVLGVRISGPTAVFLYLLSSAFVLGVTIIFLRLKLPKSIGKAIPQYRSHEWIRVAMPMMFISAMGVILNQTDTVMVGALLGTSKAGIYSVASRFAMLILFALNAVNVISGPMISSLYSKEENRELQRLVNAISLIVISYSLPIALILIVAGKWALILFGREFTSAHGALVILSLAQLVNALSGPVGYLFTMTGRQKQAAFVLGGGVLLNIFLNAIMIPTFGINGAAIATAITTITWNLVMVFLIWKYLKINMLNFLTRFLSLLPQHLKGHF